MLFTALTACSSNSIVNTPTLTPTLAPIPTPTEMPEMTRPFGNGLIGEGKIGPWVEANRIEPTQALIDNVKALNANGEVIALEVKDSQGQTGKVVFVIEKDPNGQVVKRFVAWNKDDLGVKRLAENGAVNDLDELVALPGGLGFGVMGKDGVIEPVILIDPQTGEMTLVDNFIQLVVQPGLQEDMQTKVIIKRGLREVGDAFRIVPWNADIQYGLEKYPDAKIGYDPATGDQWI